MVSATMGYALFQAPGCLCLKDVFSKEKFPKNVGDLGKLIAAKGFKKWPKVQNIAQSGHTGLYIGLQLGIFIHTE